MIEFLLKLTTSMIIVVNSLTLKSRRPSVIIFSTFRKNILDECNVDHSSFWKSVGRIGITQAYRKLVPDEVILDDDTRMSSDPSDILHKWKIEFSTLFNNPD